MNTSRFVRTKRANPCPICSDEKGKCGIKDESLFFCMTEREPVEGYKIVGVTSDEIWTMYAVGKEQCVRSPRAKKELNYNDGAALKNDLDREKQLDREYQRLSKYLGLSRSHNQNLLARGLSQKWIEFARSKGFSTWTKKPLERTYKIPGCKGKYLGAYTGMGIPAVSRLGQVVGYQLATGGGTTAKGDLIPKYVWAGGKDYGSCKQFNGEMPLFHWVHPTVPVKEIWLCEGGLKSFITATKLWDLGRTDIAVIGTGIAARYGHRSLKTSIDYLKPKKIVLCPDAGAVLNTSGIPHANYDTLDFLMKNYKQDVEIKVNWWKQFEKSKGDIDDLLVAQKQSQIIEIDPLDFFYLHPLATQRLLNEKFSIEPKDISYLKEPPPHPFPAKKKKEIRYELIDWDTITDQELFNSVVIFPKGARKEVYGQLSKFGNILDSSEGGTGKNHDTGDLNLHHFSKFSVSAFALVTTNPHNVNTETWRKAYMMRGRDGGLKVVEKMMNGIEVKEYRRALKADGKNWKIHKYSNCRRWEDVGKLAQGDYPATSEIICKGCPMQLQCRLFEGDGYGYLKAREDSKKFTHKIAHPETLNDKILNDGTVLIWDEISSMPFFKRIEVTAEMIEIQALRTYNRIQDAFNKKEADDFRAVYSALQILLNWMKSKDLDWTEITYGISHEEVKDLFVDIHEDLREVDLDLFGTEDPLADLHFDEIKGNYINFLGHQIHELPSRWLRTFLSAFSASDDFNHILSLTTSTLTVIRRNERIVKLYKSGKVYRNIMLDGSPNIDLLERIFEDRFIEVRHEEIVSRAIEEDYYVEGIREENREEVIEGLRQQFGKLELMTKKANATDNGYLFAHSRGVNFYQDCTGIILTDAPVPHIGALISEFTLAYKRNPDLAEREVNFPVSFEGGEWEQWCKRSFADIEFSAFLHNRVTAEINQVRWRLRANRRPNETLQLFHFHSYPIDRQVKKCFDATQILGWLDKCRSRGSVKGKILNALDSGITNVGEMAETFGISSHSVRRSADWDRARAWEKQKQIVLSRCEGKSNKQDWENIIDVVALNIL